MAKSVGVDIRAVFDFVLSYPIQILLGGGILLLILGQVFKIMKFLEIGSQTTTYGWILIAIGIIMFIIYYSFFRKNR